MTTKTERIDVTLPARIHAALRRAKKRTGKSMAQIVREAIDHAANRKVAGVSFLEAK